MKQTISNEYLDTLKEYHANPTAPFAGSDGKWVEFVVIKAICFGADTILNYGAGKGVITESLRNTHDFTVVEYDPAIKGKEEKPKGQFNFVICIDVLEHIEEQYISAVLDELSWYVKRGGFFTICLKPARKHTLPDGRGAHILLKSKEWWLKELMERWDVVEEAGRGVARELCVIVRSREWTDQYL